MKLYKLIAVVISVLVSTVFCSAQKRSSLIVAEFDDNANINYLQHLVKYPFVDGVLQPKELLISIPMQKAGVKGSYIRFDLGKNKIYRNRYVITSLGNVIDLEKRKILLDEKADLIAFNGDSIIFHTNDIFKGKYYSVYNLKTEKYQKVEDPNFNPVARPDVEVDETAQPFVINSYQTSGKKEVLVKDAGYGEAQPLIGENVKRKFPILWLDNSSFLYAHFPKDQQSVSIYKVGIDKSSEKIADIMAVPATAENTSFEFDPVGNIIYTCGKGRFIIDLKKKKADPVVFESLGNNFFMESVENPKYGRIIKFENTEIGKKWCRSDNTQTINGYGAFQTEMVVGTDRYPQGAAVWNSTTKKWTLLDISSIENIIGWIEE